MITNLTTESFKELVFNYDTENEFKFKGTKPAIIDFYADWCQPCKIISPIFEELSNEFPDIDFYKINTETENEIASAFEIRSIPSILFIPTAEQPQMTIGAIPKETFITAIKDIFGM